MAWRAPRLDPGAVHARSTTKHRFRRGAAGRRLVEERNAELAGLFVARWNGSSWTRPGVVTLDRNENDSFLTPAVAVDGRQQIWLARTGYAGGVRVARWNGSAWRDVGRESLEKVIAVQGTTAMRELSLSVDSRGRAWVLRLAHQPAIPEELWSAKSAELQEELRRVRTDMERHETASQACETAGLQILELAQTAYSSYVAKKPHEQARLVRTLVSNSTFDRGTLTPAYIKPFDVFARGSESGDWLAALDDFRNWLIREAA